jgi:hypothetical protein
LAPCIQKKDAIPKDTTQIDAYSQASWVGVTEQLRFRNQWMFWPETVAKRNTRFDTDGTHKIKPFGRLDCHFPMGLAAWEDTHMFFHFHCSPPFPLATYLETIMPRQAWLSAAYRACLAAKPRFGH